MRRPKAHLAQNVRKDLIPAQYKRCDTPFHRPGKHKRKHKPKECLQHRDDAALGTLVLRERNKGEKAVKGHNARMQSRYAHTSTRLITDVLGD